MSFKKASVAAVLAVSMATTPVLAQSVRSAAPTSTVARSGATTEEASDLRGGWIIPLIALIAIILGLCVATDLCGGDEDDFPTSP